MTEKGYLTLDLESGESVTFDRPLLKYITVLERHYEDGEETVDEDENFRLEWPLWALTRDLLREYDRAYGTAIGPQTLEGLVATRSLAYVQLYDLYRMLRVLYHYDSTLMTHILLLHIINRLLPLANETQKLALMQPRLGRKPDQGMASALTTPNEVINESYSVARELLMLGFTLYVPTYDLLALIENHYLPQVTSVLASGRNHVALITQAGLLVKGSNVHGQLGFGRPDTLSNRWYTSPINNVISVWCGAYHTMVLTSTRGLLACGDNSYGQLGLEQRRVGFDAFEPTRVALPQVLSVACGAEHTMALTVEGVYGFGRNANGQLGTEPILRVYVPLLVDVDESIKAVACGDHYSLLLAESGNVYHCGASMDGIPVTTKRLARVEMPEGAGKVTVIVAGARHALFLNGEGEVFVWGNNVDGQLGLGNDKAAWKGSVTKHPTLARIVGAAAGDKRSMFVDERGDLYATGSNAGNELGLVGGSQASTTVPVKVDLANVISVACGQNYTKILTCEGLFTTGGAGIQKEDSTVRVSERPICRRPRLAASANSLHCHMCGEGSKELFLHKATQRILCSTECHTKYKQFRVNQHST